MNQFFDTVGRIAASDLAMLRRFPRYAMAVLAIAMVPAFYALIYLTSVWDPNAQTQALPVAIVNLDIGVQYRGRQVNVGSELTHGLAGTGTFGFRVMPNATAAREAVRRGELAFAIVIPADFSANAVPGVKAGAGTVLVILSEGNNYASAGFARRFAVDLGHQVNETLNEQRWAQVLESADGSGRSLEDLRGTMAQLQTGLKDLERDLGRSNAAVSQLTHGVRRAGAELRTLDAKWPQDADLKQLRDGAQRLAARQRELAQRLELAHSDADKLAEGLAAHGSTGRWWRRLADRTQRRSVSRRARVAPVHVGRAGHARQPVRRLRRRLVARHDSCCRCWWRCALGVGVCRAVEACVWRGATPAD
jgi:putative membrane protein